MAAPAFPPAVTAKQTALGAVQTLETVKEAIEDNEIVKALAINPSRPDAAALSTRHATIQTNLKTNLTDQK